MSTWILSIVGVAFLGVMIDVVAPTGSINKLIKCVFSTFLIFVLMGPIKNLITSESAGLEDISTEIIEDENFLIKYNQNLASKYETQIKNKLEEMNIEGVEVSILVSLTDSDFKILEVSVWLNNLVLTNEINHTNKYEKIKSVIKSIINVQEEIVFYE